MFNFFVQILCFLVAIPLISCAPNTPQSVSNIKVDNNSSAIINGTAVSHRTTTASRSVVLIGLTDISGEIVGICTGTLISQNTVLSAAHCFHPQFVREIYSFKIMFTNNYYYTPDRLTRKGVAFKIHHLFSTHGDLDNDIALATFAGDLPAGYAPVEYDTDDLADYSEQKVYIYGYGKSLDYIGIKGETTFDYAGQLYRGVMVVKSNFNQLGTRYHIKPHTTSFICQGDSGGPNFYHENGVLKIIGVNSSVTGGLALPNGHTSCLGTGQVTKVARYASWIRSTEKYLETRLFYFYQKQHLTNR